MTGIVRRLLALFGAVRTRDPGPDHELARHNATIRRADGLLRVASDYEKADASRREHR